MPKLYTKLELEAEISEINEWLKHFNASHHLHHKKLKRKKLLEDKVIIFSTTAFKIVEV